MTRKKIVVIGGGPAGLMAAGQAAAAGADVLLLEKMNRPGRKLSITGKGRCNLTNTAEITDFITHFDTTGRFLHQAFARFFTADLMMFFQNHGLELVTERGGRVFPASGHATDVLQTLQRWLKKCGVQSRNSSPVEKLLTNKGQVTGVVAGGQEYTADAVILATGGASYPATGSTGDGYTLATAVGHTLIPIRPALVPLETAGNTAGRMAELNLRNIRVRMLLDGKKSKEDFGELTFTPFGVSGPVILTLSGIAVDALIKKQTVEFCLDLKPALDEKKLDARLLRDIAARGKEPFSSLLRGLLPREMVPVCADATGIPSERLASSINAKERRRLRTWLKNFRLQVTKARPLDEAIITAGGIDTKEIDPRTMASRKSRGLFMAGEILDLQADTGGYNLQAAFSTGWLAGRSAADHSIP
ncbi:MAG: NAD(P)/FAD-dependent oxidoreductase [Deltaproteobacteria bacterium]|nr:NAD(P)/FAD-dependent oxidoreductase [Candidatus Anaeroferrophillus wilburensis]MBN2890064.1 NAD(P)/FAD-dependent oxidoreductase [Deltaproteobacteria bacterium]